METRVGPLRAQITYGESERFTAPLLLVHGLWQDATVWRRFTGFLAHRGWRCVAVQLDSRHRGGLVDLLSGLREAIAALEAPPVVVGHDLGGLLALQVAPAARAVAALAPFVPPPLSEEPALALGHAGSWLSRRLGSFLSAPRGRWRQSYGARSAAREPARLIADLRRPVEVVEPIPAGIPALLMAGETDPVVPLVAARRLAERSNAEVLCVEGAGHALPTDEGWRECVSTLHRWLVQRLGAALLEFYEERDDD
jgi:pimeloyl-ACP methyl ester carboxylesterase